MEPLLLALAFLGLSLLVSVLLHYFSSLGKSVLKMQSSITADVGQDNFLVSLAAATDSRLTFFDTDECQIFSSNNEWYDSLIADIENASDSICISTYIWESDSLSLKLFKTLGDAAIRGVDVRLLVDGFGGNLSKFDIETMRQSCIKISIFRPFKFGKISLYVSRNHRRAYVIDETIAYIGGSSISKKWFRNSNKKHASYRDAMYRFSGEPAFFTLASFAELWTATTGEIMDVKSVPPSPPHSNAIYLNHAPRVDVHPWSYMLWSIIHHATKSIVICSPYVLPGEVLLNELIKVAKSGIEVLIITQGTREVWFVSHVAQGNYEKMLDAGIKIYEVQGPEHLHAKIVVIDEVLTIFGSANLDLRSQRINHENIVALRHETFAKKNSIVINSYVEKSKRIEQSEWKNRSVVKKTTEKVLTLFSEQM